MAEKLVALTFLLLFVSFQSVISEEAVDQGGIHQGSNKLYKKEPDKGEYERGRIVPFEILAHSYDSTFATFYYTNCVTQNPNLNRGRWKTYEMKIMSYARDKYSPNGGTLYLITGTSKVTLKNLHGGVDKPMPMKWFHESVNTDPTLLPKIAIPNSVWTVGCCRNDKNEVVEAFGVMGNNVLVKKSNKVMMAKQNVQRVEDVLHLENQKIKLFPGDEGCYDTKNNVRLIDL